MLDENDFRKRAESALGTLKKSLIAAEDSADLEVEDQAGALHISFEERPSGKFGFPPWQPALSWTGRTRSRILFCRRREKS